MPVSVKNIILNMMVVSSSIAELIKSNANA